MCQTPPGGPKEASGKPSVGRQDGEGWVDVFRSRLAIIGLCCNRCGDGHGLEQAVKGTAPRNRSEDGSYGLCERPRDHGSLCGRAKERGMLYGTLAGEFTSPRIAAQTCQAPGRVSSDGALKLQWSHSFSMLPVVRAGCRRRGSPNFNNYSGQRTDACSHQLVLWQRTTAGAALTSQFAHLLVHDATAN
ncbi:hypothetical protein EJ07DRAFT_154420 [Lizonia empirigonia]|nr:hypothetical protein EJ07DRAFT_154420 [Lizonia empirigonia]